MIVYLVSFLGGAYTRTSEVQSACTLERLAASTVFTPVQNETISIEVSTQDLANSTIALAAPNRETENYIFVGFFSSALSYMGYLTESGSLYVIGSQGCSINLTSGSNLRTGHLGAHCEISVSSVLTCTRHCYGNFTPYEWSEVIDNTLTIQNAMETRNSYGFGVTTTYEEIQSIRLVDMEDAQWWAPNASIEVLVETKVFSSVSSNASENLGRWQDTMLFVFVVVLLVNILSRLLISRLLFTGTKVYNARIALRGEIVGSLITSPSVSVFTISIFALMGSHIYSNALLFGEIQTSKVSVGFSVATACITAFNMRIVASSLGFRFSSSGVMDNLTMWGVLLLPLDTYILVRLAALFFDTENLTYFLIRRRLYVGVLVSGDTLVSRFENRRKIPRFVQDYPFHLWNGQTPNSILLR
ncbi:Hypothetical Protein FCC1311_047362 [Hondaea fermentalgiana]|uniref:Transmembrane protein n=1 Tax=Hondaea fermentalgiana TaxID=2315210 RepID=A0A2R5GIN2_9STRA|nr:Hypothetical Protein FCC1311_047362 [Hondaea fermentalgiana]|eukprot:GBG28513.1 Hypothetical Protein FCC1311_047362 [Hondaea fermentalgiana]